MAAEGHRRGRRLGSRPNGPNPNMICACVLRQQRLRQEAQAAGNVASLFQAPPPPPLLPLPPPVPVPPPPPPPPVPVAPAVESVGRTLQLFPAVRAGAAMAWQRTPEVMKAPLPMTIIYGGKVTRLENVPSDKGKKLIQLAQSVNSPPPPEKVVVVDVPDEEPPQVVAGPSAAITASQARKLSLERFLGKRKQRTDDPDEASPSKKMDAGGEEPFEDDEPDASWLSL